MPKINRRLVVFSAVLLTCSLLFIGVLWSSPSGDHRDDEPRDAVDVTYVTSDLLTSYTIESTAESTFSPTQWNDVTEDHTEGSSSSPESLKVEMVTLLHMVYPGASKKVLLQREQEYVTALQRNLNHDHIRRIHVLTENANVVKKQLGQHQLSNRSKLLIVELKRLKQFRDVYDYISENLVGVDVMQTNGDIYLGDGFDQVDPVVMRENKIMYTLTRQVKKKESCGQKDWCREWKYIGSHDTFLFHLTEPIPEAALHHIDYAIGSWGMENVLMWMFKTKLGYCLLNPCTILKTYHLHCSNIRNKRIRVTTKTTFGIANFTDDLVCNAAHRA